VFDNVLSSPKILGVPLLMLANKQDSPSSLSVEEIRESYENWWQRRQAREQSQGDEVVQHRDREERIASLDVMGVSALEGTGIRDAVNWLFIRVQNSRRSDAQPDP